MTKSLSFVASLGSAGILSAVFRSARRVLYVVAASRISTARDGTVCINPDARAELAARWRRYKERTFIVQRHC